MKKRTRRVAKVTPVQHHSGLALVMCFVLAGIAVALATRQLVLERRHNQQSVIIDETTTRLVGTYKVEIPRGKSTRTTSLALESNRTATLTQSDSGVSSPTITSGSWSGDSNGTIIVTLSDKTYAFSYTPTGTGALRLLNPDVKVWGAATLTLTRQ
jgi:hypothetical protein